MSQNVAGAIT